MPESATVPSALKGTASETQNRDKTAVAGASILASLSNQLNKEDNNSNKRIYNQNGGGGEKNQEGMGEEDDNERNNVISFNEADSTEAIVTTGMKDGLFRPDPHMEIRYHDF